jgi:hypothetical protein
VGSSDRGRSPVMRMRAMRIAFTRRRLEAVSEKPESRKVIFQAEYGGFSAASK